MKKYFITGLVILLPLAVTLAIVLFFLNLLTGPFIGIVQSLFDHYHLFEKSFSFLGAKQTQIIIAQVSILLFLFLFTVLLGFLARWFFLHALIKFWDSLIHRIPFISSVYKTCQDVINTMLTSETKSFKQVVLVPFPFKDSHSIGLVTREEIKGVSTKNGDTFVAVFVPTTPNPTSGYLVLYKPEDLIYIDMKVEEALKYIISCGVIMNEPLKALEEKKINMDETNNPS